MRGQLLLLLAPSFIILGCAAESGSSVNDPFVLLCKIPAFAGPNQPKQVVSELGCHGITASEAGGDMGSCDIFVEGSWKDAYRARDLVRRWAAFRNWDFSWIADYYILPGSERFEESKCDRFPRPPPESVRIAEVKLASSERVLQFLHAAGFSARARFGTDVDLIFVPVEEALEASDHLQASAISGLTVYPYNAEDY